MESLHLFFIGFSVFLSISGQSTDTTTPTTTQTLPITSPPTPGPSTTPAPGFDCTTDGVYPHPINCEYYIDCYNGTETLVKCQSNFLFDLRYNGCNYPEYTDCGNRTRPDGYPGTVTPPDPATTPNSGFQCPSEDGYYPDPANCAGWYQCFQGIGYHHLCPNQLRYDIMLQVCNHPGAVDCGDRPIIPTSTH